MNDHSVDFPLWGQVDFDDEALADLLSDDLNADLRAFARRWEAAVPDWVFDDRFDHLPLVPSLMDAGRAVRRLMNPAARRAAEREDAAIRAEGERLRERVQDELGPAYVVSYVP